MKLGDLQNPLNIEHGQDEQTLPVGFDSIPADVYQNANATDQTRGVKTGDPKTIAYTVATYDSRPPVGYDVVLDCLFRVQTTA